MIKTIAFDLGGVIISIDNLEPIRRFEEIGVKDAPKLLDSYTQTGLFGDLENGTLTEEEFRQELSNHIGKQLTWEQCLYAWKGFIADVPEKKLEALVTLKKQGYRLILVSNTNGFIQSWADSKEFSQNHKPLSSYFDTMYRSYEMKCMKPNESFFTYILERENECAANILFVDDGKANCEVAGKLGMQTFCPKNGEDWIEKLDKILQR